MRWASAAACEAGLAEEAGTSLGAAERRQPRLSCARMRLALRTRPMRATSSSAGAERLLCARSINPVNNGGGGSWPMQSGQDFLPNHLGAGLGLVRVI